ncbi:MAG: JAB domain-containing protein [Bdellovibrionaceae bacterium]|nr:JAB domain-containing protein [Pseudobdellovibrionaceae bacterium]
MEHNAPPTILSSTDAANWARSLMCTEQEELWILALAANKLLLASQLLFRGTADACLAHPRDIMRTAMRLACEKNAVGFLLAHNHPSGELTPSNEDWAFTQTVISCGRLFQIPLIDHLVVTRAGYTSMRSLNETLFLSGLWPEAPDSTGGARRYKARPKSRSYLNRT